MQTSKQIETIVQNKVNQANNRRTLEQMQIALKKIKAGDKIDKTYAIIGLVLILPLAYFLTITFFF